ncbi:MAG: alpha/beta hydrolase [Armatimonadota bacterium]
MRTRFLHKALFAAVLLCLAVGIACSGGESAAEQTIVPVPSWDELRAVYEYDADIPLNAEFERVNDTEYFSTDHITFDAVDGSRIPAILYLPKTENNEPVPCVLLLHGYGGDKESYGGVLAAFMAPMGIGVMAIDARLHGERAREDVKLFSDDLQRTHDAMMDTVIDNRRALDYLDTRPDIDHDRYLCMGLSMGAILGSVLGPVDDRIGSAALIVGGGRLDILVMQSDLGDVSKMREAGVTGEMLAEYLTDVEPVNFIGHFAPRELLFVNGRDDDVVTPECAQYLHEAADDPKEIVWYNGEHVPPPTVIMMSVGPFIQENLLQ